MTWARRVEALPAFWPFVASVFYFGLVSFLSHLPGSVLKELPFNIWDKAAHLIAYMPLGFLLALGMTRRPLRWSKNLAVVLTLGVVAGLGALDEFHQSFVPGRFSTLSDTIADLLGGGIGAAVAVFFIQPVGVSNHLRNSRPKKTSNSS